MAPTIPRILRSLKTDDPLSVDSNLDEKIRSVADEYKKF